MSVLLAFGITFVSGLALAWFATSAIHVSHPIRRHIPDAPSDAVPETESP